MKKSFFGFIFLLIILTTYIPNFNSLNTSKLYIKEIEIENISVIDRDKINKELKFLYEESLFFLDNRRLKKNLKNIDFIESLVVKKVYPSKIRLIITEKIPIAILHYKKKKFYISDKGDLIIFSDIKRFSNLPTVFGNTQKFYPLYKNLKLLNFPADEIKSYYFFESGRWDLIMKDGKTIKLSNNNFISDLENYMNSINDNNFKNFQIFDYRIKDQLILK